MWLREELTYNSCLFVVNYDIPNMPEIYVHRIGRTGRAGETGVALSFVGRDEKTYWQDIEKLIRLQVKIAKDHPYPWREPNPTAKKDFRNKKEQTSGNTSKKKSSVTKSRKSDMSKKKKRDAIKPISLFLFNSFSATFKLIAVRHKNFRKIYTYFFVKPTTSNSSYPVINNLL